MMGEYINKRNLSRSNFRSARLRLRKNYTASLIIYGVSLITAFLQVLPLEDAIYQEYFSEFSDNSNNLYFHLKRLGKSIFSIWNGYITVPNFSEIHFHSNNIIY